MFDPGACISAIIVLFDHYRFNPTYPNLIVGGCANGQLVLWNIEEYQDCLQINKTVDLLESRATAANKVSIVSLGNRKLGTQHFV